MKAILVELLSLSTARARLMVFSGISMLVFVTPYSFLDHAKLSLYERFHIPSPSIGLTRAYWKLLHGDPSGAWNRNKLIYLVICIIVGILLRDLIMYFSKRSLPEELSE